MLLQFYFSNYRSFEGATTLDMRAGGSNELISHVRIVGHDKVLPVAAIYGANASGKSTVFSAFKFMTLYVVQSFYLSEDNKDRSTAIMPIKPFAMSDSRDKPSEFEVNYVISQDGRERYINYGFILEKNGVCEEWLKTNSKTGIARNKEYKTIFFRKRNQIMAHDTVLDRYMHNLEISLDDHVLLASLGAKLKVKELVDVRDWFLGNEPIDCSSFIYDEFLSKRIAKGVIEGGTAMNRLLNFMHSFDDSIVDFEFKKNPKTEELGRETYQIFSFHKFNGSDELIKIPLRDESSGTIKMFSLFQILSDVNEKGSILFVDELDIKLHPLLMRNILLTFTDSEKNPNNAQLIFTTHNSVYLDMGLLRRDEIWFVEKIKNVSELYALSDFIDPNGAKVRKDANYAKNYLLGHYGAVPILSSLFGDSRNE
ncbi:MAG: ATP/GTP-binding protein [Clostridiales bacterium]|nr:ATP/GTP-binding protein [Clostridiales bacterium]